MGEHAVYVAFCDYYATGEGRTVIIAASNTSDAALQLFTDKAPPFFASAMTLIELDQGNHLPPIPLEKWLPAELLVRRVHGPISFFGMFHQNLS